MSPGGLAIRQALQLVLQRRVRARDCVVLRDHGLIDADLTRDEKLAAMCASRHSRVGRETLPLRIGPDMFRPKTIVGPTPSGISETTCPLTGKPAAKP